jgi:hypothetical protein
MSPRFNLGAALALIAVLLITPASAIADSGGATVSSLPESESLQVTVELHHQCPGYLSDPSSTCYWFSEAAAYSAEVACPITYDSARGVWVGPLETTPGTTFGTFAFTPYGLPRTIVVCLYVHAEETALVGASHPFDRATGRELTRPPSPPVPTPEPSLKGLRQCDHPNLAGAFLAASPSVSCRTARGVRRRLFEKPCEDRTYCVVKGFRCYGRWEGQPHTFAYAHHASCRSARRRILMDTG